jgi:hypothetical protein
MSNGADERGQADHFQAAWANGEQRASWMTSCSMEEMAMMRVSEKVFV